ncbi:chorismate mutase [Bdellovibrionota bacterium FG-1]
MKPEQRLQKLRARIDRCDRLLLKTLGERFATVKEIGRLKTLHDLPVHQKDRWTQVLRDRLGFSTKMGLRKKFVQALLTLIHEESIELQTGSKRKRTL